MICAGADWGLCSWWPGPLAAMGVVTLVFAAAYALFRWWGYQPVEAGGAAAGLVIVGGVLLAMVLVLTQAP